MFVTITVGKYILNWNIFTFTSCQIDSTKITLDSKTIMMNMIEFNVKNVIIPCWINNSILFPIIRWVIWSTDPKSQSVFFIMKNMISFKLKDLIPYAMIWNICDFIVNDRHIFVSTNPNASWLPIMTYSTSIKIVVCNHYILFFIVSHDTIVSNVKKDTIYHSWPVGTV